MVCRGIRGATTVPKDTRENVLSATRELLATIIYTNDINPEDVASLFITTTPDIRSVYPALAARQLGWLSVPLLGATEIDITDGLPLCIRILIHWNTTRAQSEIRHVYQGEAKKLRPDQALDLSEKDMITINDSIAQCMARWEG